MISGMPLLLLAGCSLERTVESELECYVNAVVNAQTGVTTEISRQDAIKNNFIYHLVIESGGLLSVNDSEHYREVTLESDANRSFSVIHGDNINNDVQFCMTRSFDDVEFILRGEEITYRFECEQD